jgi:hypothetical protein
VKKKISCHLEALSFTTETPLEHLDPSLKVVKVAVACGGGSLGLNIVNAIHSTNLHAVIMPSRSARSSLAARGITVRIIDCNSPTCLLTAFTALAG